MSPTQRTLKVLKEAHVPAEVVERWVKFANAGKPQPEGAATPAPGVRHDLFGMFDIVALRSTSLTTVRILGIQCCAMSGRAAHLTKLNSQPLRIDWLRAGGLIEVWAWRKVLLRRGGKAMRWRHEITPVGAEQPVVI